MARYQKRCGKSTGDPSKMIFVEFQPLDAGFELSKKYCVCTYF